MGQYIYSSALRRRAKELFEQAGASLLVGLAGGGRCEDLLFRAVGTAIPLTLTTPPQPWDAILCEAGRLEGVRTLLTAGSSVKLLAVRGEAGELSAPVFETIADLARDLDLVLVSQQTNVVRFGARKEVCLILARRAGSLTGDSIALLKLAVLLEAHSLLTAASACIAIYNDGVLDPARRVDPAFDTTYEVVPFATGECTVLSRTAPIPAQAAKVQPGRLLSMHCDVLHQPAGEAFLRDLAASAVLPGQVEMVVRTDDGPRADLMGAIRARGILVKHVDSDREFLAATAPDAQLVCYFDGGAAFALAGWDDDLLRAAAKAEGKVFALRLSDDKTRYYVAPRDAEAAPERIPTVSRAWLAACGSWSVPGVPAGVFQTLVAFYFGRACWTDKHRPLSLYPVMTVATELVGSAEPFVPPAGVHVQRRAIRAALTLHAVEWSHQTGLDAPHMEYDPHNQCLTLRRDRGSPPIRRLHATLDRSWLPL